MLSEKQNRMWEAIKDGCPTVEEAICFFVKYCGYQILDDEMWEYLRRNEYLTEEEIDN
jgi:hypothetical protein